MWTIGVFPGAATTRALACPKNSIDVMLRGARSNGAAAVRCAITQLRAQLNDPAAVSDGGGLAVCLMQKRLVIDS